MTIRSQPAFEHLVLMWRKGIRRSVLVGLVLPAAYVGAIGLGLGSLVEDRARRTLLGGASYLDFVGPGLLAAGAALAAAQEALWPVLAAIKWRRTYEAMLASPLGVTDVLRGHLLFIAARVGLLSTLYFAVIVAFGGVESVLGVLVVPFSVLTALAFAAPIAAFSATQETDLAFPLVFRLVVLPLFLFSGTFYPVSQLPGALALAMQAFPLWHGVELCRGAALGRLGAASAAGHAAYVCLWVAVGYAAATRTFQRRLVP